MGVYIKGMGKAKHCIDCPLMMCNADGDWCALRDEETNESFKSWDDMRKHCPLVEVKAPHGRLIDADEFLKDMNCGLWDWSTVDGITVTTALKQTMSDLRNAPTVLEAEGRDDGNDDN